MDSKDLHLQTLRERKEDIPLLVEHILEEERKQNNENKIISKEALAKLMGYHYPGNIRELENIIKRAHVYSKGDEISAEDIRLPQETTKKGIRKKSRFSMEKIMNALVKHRGNKTDAAKELGISRTHFYRLLNKHND